MATYYIDDQSVAALWGVGSNQANAYSFLNGQNPLASPGYANNPTIRGANNDIDEIIAANIGASTYPPASSLTGDLVWMATQHTDYNFRLWVIPSVLQLSNPQLNSDIPFRIWNTNPNSETVSSVTISGSAVLSFDLVPTDVFRDKEYKIIDMQIGTGEPTIDALITFNTTNLTADLRVIALVSDTFNLIPDVPVREIWEFQTDIMTNYLGVEQRVALRRFPRLKQEFDVEIIDLRQRREQYNVTRKNIAVQSLVPMYQYGTTLTQPTLTGSNRLYFNPTHCNIRAGEFLIVVNPTTEEILISAITAVEVDGATLNAASGFDMTTHWVVAPAINCLINNGSGITMDNVTGKLKISADSFNEPSLLRPNATRTIDTYDGLPWINRRPVISAKEDFQYRKDVIDTSIGVRDVNSRDLHPKVSGDRKFIIQRITDPDEMDYWRSLFDTTRGAQLSFLLSTWFQDLTLSSGQPDVSGLSTIEVDEGYYPSLYHQYESWNRIQIEYQNGETSQHVVTTAIANLNARCDLSITPAIPSGAEYAVPKYISFLQRWRATDRVVFRHYANYSEVSFGVISSDE